MMATEELILIINDAELKQALTSLEGIKRKQRVAKTQTESLVTQTRKLRLEAKGAGISLDDLPTLNRDMRIIGGLFPGFRGASQTFFQTRRAVRAMQLGREAAAVKDVDPELAKQLGMTALIGQVALLVVLINAVVRTVNQSKQDIEQNRGEYERRFRDGLNISHEEYKQLDVGLTGYATRFDRFQALVTSDQWMKGIAEYIRSFLLDPFFAPTVIKRDPLVSELSRRLEYLEDRLGLGAGWTPGWGGNSAGGRGDDKTVKEPSSLGAGARGDDKTKADLTPPPGVNVP